MKLVITGATGYVGQRLAALAAASGHEVICATRQPCPAPYTWLPYDLRGPGLDLPVGTQALIHLAANTSSAVHTSPDDEVEAAQALLRCAQQGTAKFIFISSQTAEATAPNVYGRTKWRIEQRVLTAGGTVIRPGQVYGGPERGLFGLLSGMVRRSPFIPILMPAPCVQPIHVDDLAASILAIAERDDMRAETLNLGAVQPIAFDRFLMSIATHRVRTTRLAIPVPVVLLRLLRRSLGQSLSTKVGLERLFSLIQLPPMDSEHSLQRIGIPLRPLAYGMHRSGHGQRRSLLQEAAVLLGYLLKSPPQKTLVRRYARALERAGKRYPIIQSRLLMRWPIFLALLDNPGILLKPDGQELAWRLQVALGIAEASRQGAQVFLGDQQPRSLVATLVALGLTAAKALVWKLAALACRPFARQLMLESETRHGA
ncbi:NAD-dependent epimerase/dehydratase family protein [Pseudomonas brassicacearum]|uniref:Sugar nucleotide-binding protein n=1 Tax=Pseudomonas brassicacearum subsp. neoaurantiaca TaxID=494916 RepID=A0A7V8RH62_9PSED|nr:NAD-dependent epimerase/dehydratase family protein [Pseudomonas brassicacearum]MBA1376351.1 sugar nucleotide-binding protein [Pseudomonas brassicacearum subsp. neoaurantiaca]